MTEEGWHCHLKTKVLLEINVFFHTVGELGCRERTDQLSTTYQSGIDYTFTKFKVYYLLFFIWYVCNVHRNVLVSKFIFWRCLEALIIPKDGQLQLRSSTGLEPVLIYEPGNNVMMKELKKLLIFACITQTRIDAIATHFITKKNIHTPPNWDHGKQSNRWKL